MADINYPIHIKYLDKGGIKILSIDRYKVLRPLSGEGYSIEYINTKNDESVFGGVVSNSLAAIHDELLHGKPGQLNDYDKIILVVRAHEIGEYFDYVRKIGAKTGEFGLTTNNYKRLINTSGNLNKMRDEVLRLMYRFFNEFSLDSINSLSIYCCLSYSIPSIKNAIDFLVKTDKINLVHSISPDSLYLDEFALNPMIFEDLDLKYKDLDSVKIENKISRSNEYDFFICHATEDKESFVDNLYFSLVKEGFKIWYDIEIKWGDSIREKIDEGLKLSKYGIVVLSRNFIREDKKWAHRELNALFAQEQKRKKILPIWHNIDEDDIREFSPLLIDRRAMRSSDGIDKIIIEAKELINPS